MSAQQENKYSFIFFVVNKQVVIFMKIPVRIFLRGMDSFEKCLS